jgi:ABC-type multidrug transport system ATPase subunit
MAMISIEKITKRYGSLTALNGISLEVERGELFGLIGPDGAGKTSLFRILATLLLADSGTATVDGLDVVHDYREIRRRIGYMPGKFSLYQDLTVEENLTFFATVFGTTIKENYHLIEDIYRQIEPFRTRRAGALSGGMKQKLALSCALIHKPTALFLDEPTTGVDAVSRKEFWEMLRKLKSQGLTILVSTPYMDEASLCDRVALIQQGEILTIDTPSGITAAYPSRLFAASSEDNYRLLNDLRQNTAVHSAYIFGDSLHVTFSRHSALDAESPTKWEIAGRARNDVVWKEIEPTIEDCFIEFSRADSPIRRIFSPISSKNSCEPSSDTVSLQT